MATNANSSFTAPGFIGSVSATSVPQKTNLVAVSGSRPYIVKEGDTLLMIAARQRGNSATYIAKVKAINNIRDDAVLAYMVGQVIQLPHS